MMKPKLALVLSPFLALGLLLGLVFWVALAQPAGLVLPGRTVAASGPLAHLPLSGKQVLPRLQPCDVPLTAVGIAGPTAGYTDLPYELTAVITPTNATPIVRYDWSPEPDDGQGTPIPSYIWTAPDLYTVVVTATNCGGTVTDSTAINIIDAEVRADVVPGVGGKLVFTDFQGKRTVVEAAGDAVDETITLVYTYLEDPSFPHSFHFAGHAFTLEAFQGTQLQPGFAFKKPVLLTIEYSDADLAGFAEESLSLRAWDGSEWSSEGITVVNHDLAANELTVSVAHLSQFALFGIGRWQVHLLLVLKDYSPPVEPECHDLVANGGFEGSTAWVIGQTRRPARYTAEMAYSGSRSALLGIKPGETDVHSYSSLRQTITLPPSLERATLTFWSYFLPGQDTGDRREVLLLNPDDRLLAVLMRTNTGNPVWTKHTFNLSAYAGQTVKLYLNAYNDGDGQGVAGFYLDDVSVQVCTVPKPPTPPPTPEPPGPPECYPYLLASPGVGAGPHGVGVNSAGQRIYVANHDGDSLAILDAASHSLLNTVPVGDGPNGVAYNPTNNQIYVANRNSNSVSVLRASDNALIKTIPVGALPDGVAVNAVTNRIYVANYGSNTVSVIDGATDTVATTIPTGLEPAMIAVDSQINKAYVSLHNESRVAVIDGAGTVTKVPVGLQGWYGIAVDELRHRVYVVSIETARIAVIQGSATTDTLLGWAEVRRTAGGQLVPLRMVAVNPYVGTTGHLYVTSAGSDGGWNKLLLLTKGWEEGFGTPRAFDVNQPREGIGFDPATLQVWVPARSANQVAVYQDGEPTCYSGAAAQAEGEYQIRVCVPGGDGTCQSTEQP